MTPTISWMTVGIIAAVVILILLVIIVLVGNKRREAKKVAFAEKEEPKQLTQEQKSGDYQAKGGFNFAPAVTDAATGGAKKEPELLANQKLGQDVDPKQQLVGESTIPPAGKPTAPEKPAAPEASQPLNTAKTAPAEATQPAVEEEAEAASAPIVMPEDTEADTKVEPVAEQPVAQPTAEPAEAVGEEEAEAASAQIVMPEDTEADTKVQPVAEEPAAEPAEAVGEQEAEAASAQIVMPEDTEADTKVEPVAEEPVAKPATESATVTEPEAAAVPPVPDTPEAQQPEALEPETAEPQEPELELLEPEFPEEPEALQPVVPEDHTEDIAKEAAEAAQTTAEGAEAALAEEHPAPTGETEVTPAPSSQKLDDIAPAAGRIGRLRGRLSRSQNAIGQGLLGILTAGDLDEDAWEEIEDTLIMADLGASVTEEVVDQLREKIAARGVSSEAEARAMLRETLIDAGRPDMDRSIKAMPYQGKPAVVLVVGVNGTGKTTTTGKLARVLTSMGHKVLLGAADTFRAAAADQLETWGRRVGATTVRGKEGADPASVAFDAVARGVEEHADVVLVDTAGRLHTSQGLMDQLGKVKRVVEKKAKVDEVLLVLDATVGQNGLMQARIFRDVVDITGVVLTKLDGTAKGGIVFRVQEELGVPVKLVGLGEGADDLAPFEVEGFVDALLGSNI